MSSYMTPYYFTGSAGRSISIWMRSLDFTPKVGLALSGSTSKIAEAASNAWQYDSAFPCAAITCSLPSNAAYKIECSSVESSSQGAFVLYVTEAQTSSVFINTVNDQQGLIQRLVYDAASDKIIGITYGLTSLKVSSSIFGIDPKTSTVSFLTQYTGQAFWDCFYNPYTQTTWVFGAGTSSLGIGSYLYEFSGSGLAVTSHSVVTPQHPTDTVAYVAYNSSSNLVLIAPYRNPFGTTASIYDCTGLTTTHQISYSANLRFPAAVTSTNQFYLLSTDGTTRGIKINASTGVTSSVSNLTASGFGLSYVPEIDRLFFENPGFTAAIVFNPNTDQPVHTIAGVLDVGEVVYDPCNNIIIMSDDNAGDPTETIGGGLEYVVSGSYIPTNFVHFYGVNHIAYARSTSTLWANNYYDNNVIGVMTQTPTGSLPQPAFPGGVVTGSLPPSPIFLEVFSGSANLIWQSGSAVATNGWAVFKSSTGPSGSFSFIGSTPQNTLNLRDEAVLQNHTYHYKVAAVNSSGTGSFSNIAAINILPCSASAFQPIIYNGYVSYSSSSIYRNFYGVQIPFTTSLVTQSISVWGRSPDFDAYLVLADSQGNILREDDFNGWTPTGDVDNAAFRHVLSSGSYTIEISSVDNNIGRYFVYVSPGSDLELSWSSSHEPTDLTYITASKYMLIGEAGPNIIFYDTIHHTSKSYQPGGGCQGAVYSTRQRRAFGWVYYGPDVHGVYTASLDEYDETGSLTAHNYYYRSPSPQRVSPNIDFQGYMSYDEVNDRILMVNNSNVNTTNSIVIFDCATRTITGSFHNPSTNAGYASRGYWMSCYSNVNNMYYIAQSVNNSSPAKLVTISGSNFISGTVNTLCAVVISYISSSNFIMLRGQAPGKVTVYDPLTDVIQHVQTDLPSQGLFEAAGVGDDCTNVFVASIDTQGGPNVPGLALLDRNTFLPRNYLPVNSDIPDSFPFTPDGWFQYSIAFDPDNNKVYGAQQSGDDNTGQLYSMRLSRPNGQTPQLAPYTSSAADTASCMTFTASFKITSSQQDPSVWYGRAYPQYVAVSQNPFGHQNYLAVADEEFMLDDVRYHNRHNWFFDTNGTRFNDYQAKFTHTQPGHAAVWHAGYWVIMSDGALTQGFGGDFVTASELLVFDPTGSLIQSAALSFGGIDWASDGDSIWVYETDGDLVYTEQFSGSMPNLTSQGANNIFIDFNFTLGQLSPTASMNNSSGYYHGKLTAVPNDQGLNQLLYINGLSVVNRRDSGSAFQSGDITASADVIVSLLGGNGAYYGKTIDFTDNATSGYGGWMGSICFCPLTQTVFMGAWGPAPDYAPLIVETDYYLGSDFSPIRTYNLSQYTNSFFTFDANMVWNRKNRTIELWEPYGNGGFNASFLVLDPVASTIVCQKFVYADSSSVEPSGSSFGLGIDCEQSTGKVFIPQRFDGDFNVALTGSIKIYKV